MNCPIHNIPFKLVPAGYSKKKQKSYNAFYACQIQGCKERPPKEVPPGVLPGQTYVDEQGYVSAAPPVPVAPVSVDPEQEIWERKDRTSVAQTSINAASTIYQGKGAEISSEVVLEYAQKIYTWILTKRG